MSRRRATMFHSASYPPPCGAFCPGCKICCDIVVEDSLVVSRPFSKFVEQGQKADDNEARPNSDKIQRQNETTERRNGKDTTPRETEVTARGDAKSSEAKDETWISRVDSEPPTCHVRHSACTTCGRSRPERKNGCRKNIVVGCDCGAVCPAVCTSGGGGGCSRNRAVQPLRRARCKSKKLRCAALCCTGRSTSCRDGGSCSPRGCQRGRCTARQSRAIGRTWYCCWSPMM